MMQQILVTGVSSGIGLALAEALLARGDTVYGLSRRPPAALMVQPNFRFHSMDLACLEALPAALRQLLQGVTVLDLAVLNAAVLGPIADLIETPLPAVDEVMRVNLWANKVILDDLLPRVTLRQVVAVSSGAAIAAHRGWNAYSISKAALNMLISLYAAECSRTHFSAIAPGIVDTAMQEQLAAHPADARFPSLDSLRRARGTPLMPGPAETAPRLLAAFGKAATHASGSFLDLNQLVRQGW